MPTSTRARRQRRVQATGRPVWPTECSRLRRPGDQQRRSREALIERYLPLARKLAWRYSRSSIPYEDLVQVASLALVKAVDRFDPQRGTAFQTFAVPTILGELKRYFRESGWALHVTRGAQERALAVSEATDVLVNRNARSPTVHELAEYLERSEEEVLDGLQAAQAYTATSLEEPRSAEEGDFGGTVESELGAEDERYELVEAELAVASALRSLPAEDR